MFIDLNCFLRWAMWPMGLLFPFPHFWLCIPWCQTGICFLNTLALGPFIHRPINYSTPSIMVSQRENFSSMCIICFILIEIWMLWLFLSFNLKCVDFPVLIVLKGNSAFVYKISMWIIIKNNFCKSSFNSCFVMCFFFIFFLIMQWKGYKFTYLCKY